MNAIKDTLIGIIGCGNIGTSMAALLTGNGYRTIVLVAEESLIEPSKKLYADIFKELENRGLATARQKELCEELLSYATGYEELSEVQLVFECAFEDLDIKYDIHRQVEEHCGKLVALASSSSALSPDDMKKGFAKHPEKLMVTHPFNPPHLVPFVEMVKSDCTCNQAEQLVYDVLEDCGRKVCVMQKCAPGFIANRLQHALLREAMYMVQEGMATARDIDKALQYSFMPRYTSVGLFEHQDSFGLDMVQNVQNYMFPYLCDSKTAMQMVDDCVAKGELGQKTGKGTYSWSGEEIEAFRKKAAEPYWKYFNWNLP